MSEIAIIIASIGANALTSMLKSPSGVKRVMTQEQIDARTTVVRGINLFSGAVLLVVTSLIMGSPLDTEGLSAILESLFAIIITFGLSQGTYLMRKK